MMKTSAMAERLVGAALLLLMLLADSISGNIPRAVSLAWWAACLLLNAGSLVLLPSFLYLILQSVQLLSTFLDYDFLPLEHIALLFPSRLAQLLAFVSIAVMAALCSVRKECPSKALCRRLYWLPALLSTVTGVLSLTYNRTVDPDFFNYLFSEPLHFGISVLWLFFIAGALLCTGVWLARPTAALDAPTAEHLCPDCGHTLPPDSLFCNRCGRKLS